MDILSSFRVPLFLLSWTFRTTLLNHGQLDVYVCVHKLYGHQLCCGKERKTPGRSRKFTRKCLHFEGSVRVLIRMRALPLFPFFGILLEEEEAKDFYCS